METRLAGFHTMARTRSRIRVILILLLGSLHACSPVRTLPLLSSSFPLLWHGQSHLPQKPLRLRMFPSGSRTAVTQRRSDQRRERRLDRVNTPEQTEAARTRPAGPRLEPIAFVQPVPPLRC